MAKAPEQPRYRTASIADPELAQIVVDLAVVEKRPFSNMVQVLVGEAIRARQRGTKRKG